MLRKKIVALICIVGLTASLSACGEKTSDVASANSSNTEGSSAGMADKQALTASLHKKMGLMIVYPMKWQNLNLSCPVTIM